MESSTPIAGLEPTPITPTSDGPTTSEGSQTSQPPTVAAETTEVLPPETPKPPRKFITPVAPSADDIERQMTGAAETLRRMGLNRASMRKILAGSKSASYLDKRVTGRVSLVFFLESAEKVSIAQGKTLELYEKATDEKVKAAALACTAQCGMAIGNLAVYIQENGERYGSDEPTPQRLPGGINVNVQVNNGNPAQQPDNFPPIAKPPTPPA